MNPPGRPILIVAVIALLVMMGGIVYYASLDNDDLSSATIELEKVELIDVNSIENSSILKVTFLVGNPGEVTVTVPVISYKLYADGSEVGSGTYSTEDIAMPGRAAFYPDAEIPLYSKMSIVMSEMNETVYNKIISGQPVQYSATGMMTVESAWSIVELSFDTSS
ncbi:MAG: hypothetical protein O3C04_06210 [Crenarchaeota archaeon]|nr:hypothetical protein [Thermoproteota archaeon]MDA1125217.1 hypothetical protein [Thermoproteota archaeon]